MDTKNMAEMQIKGIKDGLLTSLGQGEWSQVTAILIEQIKERGAFFQGAKLIIDAGDHIVHAAELSDLRDQLADLNVMLWAVLSTSEITENAAKLLGMATRIATSKPKLDERQTDQVSTAEEAVLVERTLRSGIMIQNKGHVTVIGDVNPGAVVVSSGNILIWGKVRGMVHAGAEGDQDAVVCALDLSPSQLRIADVVSISPAKRGKVQPEIARIKDGKIVVEAWNSNKARGK